MKTLLVVGGVFVSFVLFFGLWLKGSYNSFIASSVQIDTTYAAIQSQYQRRFDLLPDLQESTKGFLQQEQKVFGDIAEARKHYDNSKSGSSEQIGAMGQYNSALSRLLVIVENYPQLKSDQTVRHLMDELVGTENEIRVARDRYNESVRTYNILVRSFPKNFIAGMFGFQERPMFEAEVDAQKDVKIKLTE